MWVYRDLSIQASLGSRTPRLSAGGLRLALEGPLTRGPLHAPCFLPAVSLFVAPLAAPRALQVVPQNLVPCRGRLCAATWWALCYHLVDLVPPLGGLCATTRWALCFLAVRRVPPRGRLAAGNPRPVTNLGCRGCYTSSTSRAAVLQQLWFPFHAITHAG